MVSNASTGAGLRPFGTRSPSQAVAPVAIPARAATGVSEASSRRFADGRAPPSTGQLKLKRRFPLEARGDQAAEPDATVRGQEVNPAPAAKAMRMAAWLLRGEDALRPGGIEAKLESGQASPYRLFSGLPDSPALTFSQSRSSASSELPGIASPAARASRSTSPNRRSNFATADRSARSGSTPARRETLTAENSRSPTS